MNCPLIAIAGSIDKEERQQVILREYMSAIAEAGGLPMLMSYDMTPAELDECVRRMDGLMLAGGNDLAPELYGQRPVMELGEVNPLRDRLELAMVKAAVGAGKPVFGICRGIQSLNVAFGGTLYQDLPAQHLPADGSARMAHVQTRIGAYPSHRVRLEKGSLLHGILQAETAEVNSFHHQAVNAVAPAFLASATAEDGVIEAIEHRTLPFVLGVQWHPERMYRNEPTARRLFEAFVSAAGR